MLNLHKFKLTTLSIFSLFISSAYAAQTISLNHQPVSTLQHFSMESFSKNPMQLRETSRDADFNHTLHVRMKQYFNNIPVVGGEAILHLPHAEKNRASLSQLLSTTPHNASLDGIIYEKLAQDLGEIPPHLLSKNNENHALQVALDHHTKMNPAPATHQSVKLVIYIDHDKAQYAYLIHFNKQPSKAGQLPAKPVYLINAKTFAIYQTWDDIKTQHAADGEDSLGGGDGGNEKMGELVYDGINNDLPKLNIERNALTKTCYLENKDVVVKNYKNGKVISFGCDAPNAEHDNVFWDGESDKVNGGYSPGNDALFGGAVIKNMYLSWYGVPVLTRNHAPMLLTMVVHEPIDNAYWDGDKMTFGDGENIFYPLTSLGVAAHEISHGFTEQHSDLAYYGEAGGMNEAFSDMAAQAAEYFAYAKNSWQIGPEIFKAKDKALRYMDKPSKDCEGRKPGRRCSIDHVSQYVPGLDVHYSSGIYNRVFYLIGTAANWDVKKAFDIMIQANAHYWTGNTNFASGACGVLKATKDHGYDLATVESAFTTVGIDISHC